MTVSAQVAVTMLLYGKIADSAFVEMGYVFVMLLAMIFYYNVFTAMQQVKVG